MIVAVAALLIAHPAPCVAEDSADCTAILEASRAFSAAYVAEDFDGLVSHYTEDGVAIPGSRPPIVGREALLKYWTLPEGADVIEHRATSDELVVMGDLAYDRGTYEGATVRGGETFRFGGNYLIVWRRGADGQWRTAQDMWASK